MENIANSGSRQKINDMSGTFGAGWVCNNHYFTMHSVHPDQGFISWGNLFQSNCYTFIFNQQFNFNHVGFKCKTKYYFLKLEKLLNSLHITKFFLDITLYKLLLKQTSNLKIKFML